MLKKHDKENRGSEIITTPIVIAIGMILVATLIVFCINILMPYIWYEKLSSTCLKYVFIMEEYGYLTNREKTNLINDLRDQGFDTTQLIVNSTSKRQMYGSPIAINVRYIYKMKLPIVGNKNVVMNIKRESVSKR